MDTLLRCKEFEKFLPFFSSVVPDMDREIPRNSSQDTRLDLMMMYFGKLCSTLVSFIEEQEEGRASSSSQMAQVSVELKAALEAKEDLAIKLEEREYRLDIALKKISEQETVLERAQMANVQLNQELKLSKVQIQAESEKVIRLEAQLGEAKAESEKISQLEAQIAKARSEESSTYERGVSEGQRRFLISDVGQSFLEAYRSALLDRYHNSTTYLVRLAPAATQYFDFALSRAREQLAALGFTGELDRDAALEGAPVPSGWSGDVNESPDVAWWEDALGESITESGLDFELPAVPLL